MIRQFVILGLTIALISGGVFLSFESIMPNSVCPSDYSIRVESPVPFGITCEQYGLTISMLGILFLTGIGIIIYGLLKKNICKQPKSNKNE